MVFACSLVDVFMRLFSNLDPGVKVKAFFHRLSHEPRAWRSVDQRRRCAEPCHEQSSRLALGVRGAKPRTTSGATGEPATSSGVVAHSSRRFGQANLVPRFPFVEQVQANDA